jgi:response regulator of citrate/malate metabolism
MRARRLDEHGLTDADPEALETDPLEAAGVGLVRLRAVIGCYDSRQLTVDQIARAVGSSSSTVYRYLNTSDTT